MESADMWASWAEFPNRGPDPRFIPVALPNWTPSADTITPHVSLLFPSPIAVRWAPYVSQAISFAALNSPACVPPP
jgi:hypothetical protein